MSIVMKKNALFDHYRDVATLIAGAGYNYGLVDSNLLLRTLKVVGPEFNNPDYFSDVDTSFVNHILSGLMHAGVPLLPDFEGTFDTLRYSGTFQPSDFLESDDQSDILSINFIIGRPEGYDHKSSSSFQRAVDYGELSKHHFEPDAWRRAAESHQAKLIFVFGGATEITPNDFAGERYAYLTTTESREHGCSIMIDRKYWAKLKTLPLNPHSPIAQAIMQQPKTRASALLAV